MRPTRPFFESHSARQCPNDVYKHIIFDLYIHFWTLFSTFTYIFEHAFSAFLRLPIFRLSPFSLLHLHWPTQNKSPIGRRQKDREEGQRKSGRNRKFREGWFFPGQRLGGLLDGINSDAPGLLRKFLPSTRSCLYVFFLISIVKNRETPKSDATPVK